MSTTNHVLVLLSVVFFSLLSFSTITQAESLQTEKSNRAGLLSGVQRGSDKAPARTLGERGNRGACDTGLGEAGFCFGADCDGSSSRCFKDVNSWRQFYQCGLSGLRACSGEERNKTVNGNPVGVCGLNLTEVFGCHDYPNSSCSSPPYGSSSRCFESLEQYHRLQMCGGKYQRACTGGERPTIKGISGGACNTPELKEVDILNDASCPGGCRGSNTRCIPVKSTFLTCHTKTSNKSTDVGTSWQWALDPNSQEYYVVEGYWYSDKPGSNMFYTNQSQESLKQICADTLRRKNLPALTDFFAANYSNIPFNYSIWTNDSPGTTTGINKVIAFGDSLSDTGNLLNRSANLIPNIEGWFHGRFSNNHVWIEYLASQLKLPLYNWAFGAAHAEDLESIYKIIAPTFGAQIDSWKAYMRRAKNYQVENTLFVVFIGANDIKDTPNTVELLIQDVEVGLYELILAGAQQILVLNLPDISQAPQVRNGNPDAARIVKANVDDYNTRLKGVVEKLSSQKTPHSTTVKMVLFDIHTLFDDMLAAPGNYGMNVTDKSCVSGLHNNIGDYVIRHPGRRPECTAVDAKGWVFWDEVHPTTATHKMLADGAFQAVQPLLKTSSTSK